MRIIAAPNDSSNPLEVVKPNGDLIWAVSPTGGVGVLLDYTLPAQAADITVGLPDLSGVPMISVFGSFRVNGAGEGVAYTHARMQANGDTTAGHYDWGVQNSDNTFVQGTPGAETSIMVSHASTSAADASNFAHTVLRIPFPGGTDRIKQFTMDWAFFPKFDGSAQNPLGTVGAGFWNSTAALTSLRFFSQSGDPWVAGCRIVVLAG